MLSAIIVICSIAVLIYAVYILRYGLVKTRPPGKLSSENDFRPFITVVVPFRNEIMHLQLLFEDLRRQELVSDKFEVIFVDDYSEDGSTELLRDLIRGEQSFSLFSLTEGTGKKMAVDAGVLRARGDWIVQLDADCRIPRMLISEYAAEAAKNECCLIAGPVCYFEGRKLWNKCETLEFLSLAGSGMYAFQTGRPVMCNGANMAYEKAFYMKVREKLLEVDSPSGDDVFLLLEAKKQIRGPGFLYSKDAVVQTYPSGSLWAFIRQRIRWGSKTKMYKDRDIVLLALVVYLANLALAVLFVLMFFVPQGWQWFFSLCGFKLLVDFVLMKRTLRFYDRKGLLWLFPLTALFYYFYIVITGPLSLLSGFSWKGRDFK